jgi:hypothetical protein
MEIPPAVIPASSKTLLKEKTLASIMSTQKVRSTRSSRLREEQHRAAAAAIAAQRTMPAKLPSSSSASSTTSTPSVAANQNAAPVPPLNLGKLAAKSKLKNPMYQTLRNPIPPVHANSNSTTSKKPVATTTPSAVLFSDSDPSPASSINSRPVASQPQSHSSAASSRLATPSTSSASSMLLSTPQSQGVSLFSMPPQSTASPRFNSSASMSILHLSGRGVNTPSPSISSMNTSSKLSSRSRALPPKPSSLSSAQRAVLEDIHIIADWLSTVQQSEPQHLLQFRSVIQRMKKTIFMPAQVRRARAQQKMSAPASSSSTARPSATATRNMSPLQRKIARLVATGVQVHIDHTSSFDSSVSGAEDDEAVSPHDYAADDSDYDELDGGGGSDFDSKLSSFLRKTTKRDEEVLKSGTGGYPHAAGVAFENGRWVPKDTVSTNQPHRFSSHRSHSSDGPTGDLSDDDALDDIPDFSQSASGVGEDHSSSTLCMFVATRAEAAPTATRTQRPWVG